LATHWVVIATSFIFGLLLASVGLHPVKHRSALLNDARWLYLTGSMVLPSQMPIVEGKLAQCPLSLGLMGLVFAAAEHGFLVPQQIRAR
jgi:hypothetical protein